MKGWVGHGAAGGEKYQMAPSDKNRKTKRANKMLAVTKAVEIKWAAKAETTSGIETEQLSLAL